MTHSATGPVEEYKSIQQCKQPTREQFPRIHKDFVNTKAKKPQYHKPVEKQYYRHNSMDNVVSVDKDQSIYKFQFQNRNPIYDNKMKFSGWYHFENDDAFITPFEISELEEIIGLTKEYCRKDWNDNIVDFVYEEPFKRLNKYNLEIVVFNGYYCPKYLMELKRIYHDIIVFLLRNKEMMHIDTLLITGYDRQNGLLEIAGGFNVEVIPASSIGAFYIQRSLYFIDLKCQNYIKIKPIYDIIMNQLYFYQNIQIKKLIDDTCYDNILNRCCLRSVLPMTNLIDPNRIIHKNNNKNDKNISIQQPPTIVQTIQKNDNTTMTKTLQATIAGLKTLIAPQTEIEDYQKIQKTLNINMDLLDKLFEEMYPQVDSSPEDVL